MLARSMAPVSRFLLVCLAGAAGTGARYLVVTGLQRALGSAFPYGTLTVNLAGSFLLGLVMELGLSHAVIGPDARVILAAGVMGGFTTYSSFNYETLAALQRGAFALAGGYVAGTLLGCLAAGALGVFTARALLGG
jgi:CrcB protein